MNNLELIEYINKANKTELSKQLGISRQHLHNYTSGKHEIPTYIKLSIKFIQLKELIK